MASRILLAVAKALHAVLDPAPGFMGWTPLPVPPPADELQKKLLDAHNLRRRDLPKLSLNAKLNASATKFATEMAKTGRLSHTGQDGSQSWDRIAREGYKWTTCGENIAMGYRNVEQVMSGWMSDWGHRSNVQGANFKDVGFGVVPDKNGVIYWCADYGNSKT